MTLPHHAEPAALDETSLRIATLWREGHTAEAIGQMLGGRTKNFVIGRVKAMREKGVRLPHRRETTVNVQLGVTPDMDRPPVKVNRDYPPPAPRTGITAETWPERSECNWPLGHPIDPDFRFCRAPRNGHALYCDKHRAMAYRPRDEPKPEPAVRPFVFTPSRVG